jgi:hypothetical protein
MMSVGVPRRVGPMASQRALLRRSPDALARTVLATEIVFASNLVGAGREWSITTGFSDVQTIGLLREIQGRLSPSVRSVIGNEFGTKRPASPPI